MSLRFFSVRVFGALVDAHVVKQTKTYVTLACYFWGIEWKERRKLPLDCVYADGHPLALHAETATFTLGAS